MRSDRSHVHDSRLLCRGHGLVLRRRLRCSGRGLVFRGCRLSWQMLNSGLGPATEQYCCCGSNYHLCHHCDYIPQRPWPELYAVDLA